MKFNYSRTLSSHYYFISFKDAHEELHKSFGNPVFTALPKNNQEACGKNSLKFYAKQVFNNIPACTTRSTFHSYSPNNVKHSKVTFSMKREDPIVAYNSSYRNQPQQVQLHFSNCFLYLLVFPKTLSSPVSPQFLHIINCCSSFSCCIYYKHPNR